MRKIVVLIGVLAVAAGIDLYRQSRSRPVPRPAGVRVMGTEAGYDYKDAAGTEWQEAYWPVVEEYLKPLPANASVIDLGCGNGSFLSRFRGRGWQLAGVDFSRSGIAIARAHWPDIRFEVADATGDLSAAGYGSHDAVISTEVIEHILLPRKFTANCLRLLKPGGTLVISTPYNGYLKNLGVALLGWSDRFWNPLWDYGHIKFWSVDTFARLLYESGFEQVEWRGTGGIPHFWVNMVFRAKAPRGRPLFSSGVSGG